MPTSTEMLVNDVYDVVSAGRRLPDQAPPVNPMALNAAMEQFSLAHRISHSTVARRANRSKRKMLFTLAGPVPAMIAAAAVASGPVGWAILGAAGAGAGAAAGALALRKIWRNARAYHCQSSVEDFINEGRDDDDTIQNVRFWIQKRRLSSIADSMKDVLEAWERYAHYANPAWGPYTCEKHMRMMEGFYRAAYLTREDLGSKSTEFIAFNQYIMAKCHEIIEDPGTGFNGLNIDGALRQVRIWTRHGNHDMCGQSCYREATSTMDFFRSRMNIGRGKTLFLGGRGGTATTDPFLILMNYAIRRVKLGLGTSQIYRKNRFDDYTGFLPDYIPGWRLAVGTFINQNAQGLSYKMEGIDEDTAATIREICKLASYGGQAGAAAVGAIPKALSSGASFTNAQFNLAGQLLPAMASRTAGNLTVNIINAASGFGGGAILGLLQALGDAKNINNEIDALQRGLGNNNSEQVITALRTLLKDGGLFEAIVDQFVKVKSGWETFKAYKNPGTIHNCDEAFNLTVDIMRAKVHWEKLVALMPVYITFNQLLGTAQALVDDDSYKEKHQKSIERVDTWFASQHGEEACPGWCYSGQDVGEEE